MYRVMCHEEKWFIFKTCSSFQCNLYWQTHLEVFFNHLYPRKISPVWHFSNKNLHPQLHEPILVSVAECPLSVNYSLQFMYCQSITYWTLVFFVDLLPILSKNLFILYRITMLGPIKATLGCSLQQIMQVTYYGAWLAVHHDSHQIQRLVCML